MTDNNLKKSFRSVILSLRKALIEQLDWSLEDLGSNLDAIEMKFIYAFYDLLSGREVRVRVVYKLVSDFKNEKFAGQLLA